jgi:glycosyltransferase involved in cell wall biosynthesis
VRELPPERLADEPFDLVVLQRPHELELVESWLGRRPGVDLPAVFVEHNTPLGAVPDTPHPLASQRTIPICHVTGFNDLMWDPGEAPTTVIEHGVVDPGARYTGELARAGIVVNDPVRRGRSVGADLIPGLAEAVGADVFGMRVDQLPTMPGLEVFEDLPQERMHGELARRRVYLHTARWTSLGLSLIEAMHLGMPVVALGTTEAPFAVPREAGVVTTRRPELVQAARHFACSPRAASEAGAAARTYALERFGLKRFLADWDAVLASVAATGALP